MNYALKLVLKKVIKNYLNLSQQLQLDSGVIKIPSGTLNHTSLNQKFQKSDIQIKSSTYKGLNISIPVMQLMSKPVKLKIDLFQVVIHIGKQKNNKKKQQYHKSSDNHEKDKEMKDQINQVSQNNQKQRNRSRKRSINQNKKSKLPQISQYRQDSPRVIHIKSKQDTKQLQIKSKSIEKGKQKAKQIQQQQSSWSPQYLKQMVNRILYNLQVSIQKAKITVIFNNQVLPESQIINLEIHQLHIRNSISNLQANIIKKTINLKQVCLNSDKLGVVKIQDFNVGVDYAFQQLKIIAIIWNIQIQLGKLTNLKEKQSFIVKAIQNFLRKSKTKKQKQFNSQIEKIKNIQEQIKKQDNMKLLDKKSEKQKLKTVSIYLRLNQISIKAFRLLLKSQNLQTRIFINKNSYQKQNTFSLNLNSIKIFRTLNKDQQQIEEQINQSELILQINGLEKESKQLTFFKRFSQYEDHNLKNGLIIYDSHQSNNLIKIYNIMVRINYERAKKYIENILNDYYDLFGKILLILKLRKQKMLKSFPSQTSIPSQQKIEQNNIQVHNKQKQTSLILYKFMIVVEDFINNKDQSFRNEQKLLLLLSNTLTHSKYQTHLKILQFKAIFNQYNILKLENLKAFIQRQNIKSINQRKLTENIVVVGGDIQSQSSMASLLRLLKGVSKIIQDISEIKFQFKRFLRRQTQKIKQSIKSKKKIHTQNQLKDQIQKAKKFEKKKISFYRIINFKMIMAFIKVGHYLYSSNETINVHDFKSIFQLQLSNINFRLNNSQKEPKEQQIIQENQQKQRQESIKSNNKKQSKKLKIKFDLIGFAYSPHTLQKIPFTNQIQFEISKQKQQITILFKNAINLTIDDNFIKIMEVYIKNQTQDYHQMKQPTYNKILYHPFLQFINCTKDKLRFVQKNLNTDILPVQTKKIFLQGSKGYFVLIQQKLNQGNKVSSQTKSKQINLNDEALKQKEQSLVFDHREDKNILITWIDNKKLLIKNKFLIGFYPMNKNVIESQIYIANDKKKQAQNIQIEQGNEENQSKIIFKKILTKQYLKIPIKIQDQNPDLYTYYQDAAILQQITQQHNLFQAKITTINSYHSKHQQKQTVVYKIDNLLKNQKFGLHGLRSSINPLYDYYILERKSLSSVFMQILPFLVIENELNTQLYIKLKHRKTQQIQQYSIPPKSSLPILSNSRFDFYMKQFTFAVMILPTIDEEKDIQIIQDIKINSCNDESMLKQQKNLSKQNSKQNEEIDTVQQFLSQQHYFNTFFMVEDQFQTVVQLRSDKKNKYEKQYLLITESIVCKTKVLNFSSPIKILNKSSFNLELQYKQRIGLVKKINISKKSEYHGQLQIKDGDILNVLYEGLPQNTIQIPYKLFTWGINNPEKNILLFFNFCKLPQDLENSEQIQCTNFYQIVLSLKYSVIKGVQTLIFQDFIQITNLTKGIISMNIRKNLKIKTDHKSPLILKSTVDYRYNNKAVQMNIGISEDMENLYKALFLQKGLKPSSSSNSLKKQINNPQLTTSHQHNFKNKSNLSQNSLMISFEEYANWNVSFNELLIENSKQSSTNQGKQKKIYTLLKDLKQKISFFICQDIFNTNGHYTLFKNTSDKYFLLNEDRRQYSNSFKPKDQSQQQQQINENDQKNQQKILIKPYSCCKMNQRQNQQILLCDQNQSHFHKLNQQTLLKQGIKYQLHQFSNFSLYDVEEQLNTQKNRQIQLITQNMNIRIKSKSNMLSLSLNAVLLRMLEKNKIDCLLTDITLSQQHNGKKQQILFVPDQSYFLLQGKSIDQKFYLIKNMFVKCKYAILNIHDKLPNGLLSLYKAFGLQDKQQKNTTVQTVTLKQDPDLKLKRYLQEQIFLVKNIYIHEIHLSLTIKMQSLDFSNTITLLPFELSSKSMKGKNLKNQISKFYLTNMLAKFPKLSFFLQNLKNPLNIIKTLFSIRQAIKQKFIGQKIITLNQNLMIPKYFSLQAYNLFNKKNQGLFWIQTQRKYYIIEKDSLLILSTSNSQKQQPIRLSLKQLQKIKMIRNKSQSQIGMTFKQEINVTFYSALKNCEYFMYVINNIVD